MEDQALLEILKSIQLYYEMEANDEHININT